MKLAVIVIALLSSFACSAAQPTLKAGDEFQDCTHCPVMVVVPPGKFMMGVNSSVAKPWSPPWHQEEITHRFAVGKFEVLVPEYYACVDAGACKPVKVTNTAIHRLRPAYNLNWYDAKAYADWLAAKTGKPYRLLTELEWEYAAKAGRDTLYWWGDEFKMGMVICGACQKLGAQVSGAYRVGNKTFSYSFPQGLITSPVGGTNKVPPNPFGLYYMLGNVSEWTSDCHQGNKPHPSKYVPTPKGAKCKWRIYRGFDYNHGGNSLWAGERFGMQAERKGGHGTTIGTRIALSME